MCTPRSWVGGQLSSKNYSQLLLTHGDKIMCLLGDQLLMLDLEGLNTSLRSFQTSSKDLESMWDFS